MVCYTVNVQIQGQRVKAQWLPYVTTCLNIQNLCTCHTNFIRGIRMILKIR